MNSNSNQLSSEDFMKGSKGPEKDRGAIDWFFVSWNALWFKSVAKRSDDAEPQNEIWWFLISSLVHRSAAANVFFAFQKINSKTKRKESPVSSVLHFSSLFFGLPCYLPFPVHTQSLIAVRADAFSGWPDHLSSVTLGAPGPGTSRADLLTAWDASAQGHGS